MPTLQLCKLVVITNLFVFIIYFIAVYVVDIYFLFGIKLLFFIFCLSSAQLCYKERIDYIDFHYDLVGKEKWIIVLFWCINFYVNNQSFVVLWMFTLVRIVGQIGYEWISYRYALPPVGGIIINPQTTESHGVENEKVPVNTELSAEETKKVEKDLRNNTTIIEVQPVTKTKINTLPKVPSMDKKQFVFDVINNLDEFKGLSKEDILYTDYKKQFEEHRKKDKEFPLLAHDSFKEFLSCMRLMIITGTDKNGNIISISYPINEERKIDFISQSKGIQAKELFTFNGGDLDFQRQKYGTIIEDEKNTNFCVQTVYDNLKYPEDIKELIEKSPDVMRGQEVIKRDTLPPVTENWVEKYFKYAADNNATIQKTHKEIQKNWIPSITKPEKVAQIEEVKIYPEKRGCPSYYIVRAKIPTRIK